MRSAGQRVSRGTRHRWGVPLEPAGEHQRPYLALPDTLVLPHLAPGPLFRYALSYIECVQGIKKGDTVMQIGVGSGIKCGVLVWKVSSGNVQLQHEACCIVKPSLSISLYVQGNVYRDAI